MLADDDAELHLEITALPDSSEGSSRLLVAGDLDLLGAEALGDALQDVPEGTRVVLDLSAIEFIDSSGIRALIIARTAHSARLVEPSRAVRHTFEIANVLHLLEDG